MSNPRPASRGFIAIDCTTGEIVSIMFARREPARDVCRDMAANGRPRIGVHQVKMYPGEVYDRATYKP